MGQHEEGWRSRLRNGAGQVLAECLRNWRLLVGGAVAITLVSAAVEFSDRQGRFDIPSGYAVRMTCESDPEASLWNGGCERIASDIARTDKPSFLDLYRAFVTAHHWHIPSSATQRAFAGVHCEPGFDIEAALKGTRYVFIPLRRHFTEVCTKAEAEAVMRELDERDRALLTIERGGLSHSALYAGALANLTEPVILFLALVIVAALLIL
jgi:hypothetical protein